jgi:hypothetical protein
MVLWMRDTFGINTFIETGTLRAETAVWASKQFKRVVTIEGFEPVYAKAKENFGHIKNIEFMLGDSRAIIPQLLKALKEPVIFWLDAHYCGPETFGKGAECPVMEEIAAVNGTSIPHFVLVDDARFFLSPVPHPHNPDHWPDLGQICKELQNAPMNRFVAVHEDVILGVPPEARKEVVKYLRWDPETAPPPPPPGLKSKLRRGLKKIKSAVSG